MPTPVADLLNSPSTTVILDLRSASGWRVFDSSMVGPLPLGQQWSGLTPQPMNSAANRFGHAAAGAAPHTATDSSHGRPIVTPTPCRNVRRETCDRRVP